MKSAQKNGLTLVISCDIVSIMYSDQLCYMSVNKKK